MRSFNLAELAGREYNVWPNGPKNLTDGGRSRMFLLGRELGKLYRSSMAPDASKLLALSSRNDRAYESISFALRGFYNIETKIDDGLKRMSELSECKITNNSLTCPHQIPFIHGDEWKRVKIITKFIPSLESDYFNDNCFNGMRNVCPQYEDLYENSQIKAIPGVEKLRQVVTKLYKKKFDYDFPKSYSNLVPILAQSMHSDLINVSYPMSKWIFTPIITKGKRVYTLKDVFESLSSIYLQACARSFESYLEVGPIIGSLLESQRLAVGDLNNVTRESGNKIYSGKDVIIYSTHDTIITTILYKLGIIRVPTVNDAESFFKISPDKDEIDGFLAGVKTIRYGATFIFELWQSNGGFNYLKLLAYDQDSAWSDHIKFRYVEIGSICNQKLLRSYPQVNIESYYKDIGADVQRSMMCPFEIWKNISTNLIISREEFNYFCYLGDAKRKALDSTQLR